MIALVAYQFILTRPLQLSKCISVMQEVEVKICNIEIHARWVWRGKFNGNWVYEASEVDEAEAVDNIDKVDKFDEID